MRTVLITGSNRGLGLEFVKQLSEQNNQIIATCRDPEKANDLKNYAKTKNNISIYPLDVTDDRQIIGLAKELKNIALDWIINNSGISGQSGVTVGNIDRDNFLQVMNVNCLSALKVSDTFLPLLLKGNEKLIVNISSAMGSISDNQWGRSYAYRASKAALNCVMRSFALDVSQEGIKVMLLNPGWVKTRMGGVEAQLDAEKSVQSMLKVIEKHKDQSHGEALRNYDDKVINW
ncbi:SDR family oxidoreductase [Legionella hackeliae]|uniref:Short-chain dehydrogenase/reductase SDR n=1 Tax=Legionella hackeliae TaxID=449 RepID=A0A0A8UMH8_LEGHA|nr:SDR family oxidoreductase [Legionella hackeliae]KTD10557.1 short chain dehydrogenase/reductase family transporter protein [Legionella hackeliae]CEK10060.1 Short-chain dehydrogenase/reductase SDR [Legionella hackeliae]STX46786.1 short-chain dehydrogenase [Legionella hackeliae]